VHSHSQAAYKLKTEYQLFISSSEGAQPLASWIEIKNRISVIQIKLRRCTATHKLDRN